MCSVQVSLFRQDLKESISIAPILRLTKSWPSVISCLIIERGCWLACLRCRNDWSIGHSIQALPLILIFNSCSLQLVEFFELRRHLRGCAASFFAYLHLLSLVNLVEILFDALLLVHLFTHDPFLLLLFFDSLLFHLISKVALVLFFLHLFHFLHTYTWLCRDSIARLPWRNQIAELVPERSTSTALTEFRHEAIISTIVKIVNILFASLWGSVGMFTHCWLLRADLAGLAEAYSFLLLWTVKSTMDFLLRHKNLFSWLLRCCYDTCHLLIQIIFTDSV